MKRSLLRYFSMAGIGLAVVVWGFYSCKPEQQEEESAWVDLYSGNYTGEPIKTNLYRVCTDQASYEALCKELVPDAVIPKDVDFSMYQVLVIIDTLRPYPLYRIGVSKVDKGSDMVNVYVTRERTQEYGAPTQAFSLVRIPRNPAMVQFFDLPFEKEVAAALGVGDCKQNTLKSSGDQEEDVVRVSVVYRFTQDGRLVFTLRNFRMNCADLEVVSTITQEGRQLKVEQEEIVGPDGMITVCECFKDITFETEVPSSQDSLSVEWHITGIADHADWSFKISGNGSGEVLWPHTYR